MQIYPHTSHSHLLPCDQMTYRSIVKTQRFTCVQRSTNELLLQSLHPYTSPPPPIPPSPASGRRAG